MPQIHHYSVQIFGGADGHNGSRAQIMLLNENRISVGSVRFRCAGHSFPPQPANEAGIHIHLPESLLGTVVDILRNETPVSADKTALRFLVAGIEPVGEGEA
jgi:hypothetical protein